MNTHSLCVCSVSTLTSHGGSLDDTGDEQGHDALAITALIVMGAILAIQYTILVLTLCCKVWDRANGTSSSFRHQSEEPDSELQCINRFPFLPSYEMAVGEDRSSPPNIYTT